MAELNGGPSERPQQNFVNKWLKGCLVVSIGLAVVIIAVVIAATICGEQGLDDPVSGTSLTDMEFNQVADELTSKAIAQNWCYKRTGGLDSRDMYVLVVHAELVADGLFGDGPYFIEEDRLREHLIQRNWNTFIGPDYDTGGTETRYRPPGCG